MTIERPRDTNVGIRLAHKNLSEAQSKCQDMSRERGGVLMCMRGQTWRVLRRGQGGHGVGQVEVGRDAELTLTGGRIRGGGRAQLLLAALLLGRGQVALHQGLQELHNQLGVVRYLGLLQGRRGRGRNDKVFQKKEKVHKQVKQVEFAPVLQ